VADGQTGMPTIAIQLVIEDNIIFIRNTERVIFNYGIVGYHHTKLSESAHLSRRSIVVLGATSVVRATCGRLPTTGVVEINIVSIDNEWQGKTYAHCSCADQTSSQPITLATITVHHVRCL